MRQFSRHLLISFLMLAAALTPVRAQDFQGQDDNMGARVDDEESKPDKKYPSFWHRPAMATSAEQFAYAEKLLAEGQTKKAAKHYNALVYKWGQSVEAADAQLKYAQLLELRGKHRSAFEEYQYLIEYYSGRFDYPDVIDRQFRLANATRTTRRARLTLFNKIVLCPGFLAPERAVPMFEQIVENAPTWDGAAEAQFLIGVIQQDLSDYDEASLAFEIFQRRYRNSPRAEEAAFRDGECLYLSVKQRPRDEQSYRLALSALASFIRDYPRSEKLADAQKYLDEMKASLASMYYERATYYDTIAHRPKSAIIAYNEFIRNFPTSDLAIQANERIKELKQLVEKQDEEYHP